MADASSTPELPTMFPEETLQKKGLCPVTKARGQDGSLFESHSIYYELHGTGPEHILFVMGLNSSCFAWLPQVKYFGNDPKYSVLVFDNRGVGNSDTPRGPYTTHGMAEDVVVLLDSVGWTEPRSVHIVGVSMGGMVAQELALLIGERIISLTLGVTTPGGYPWQNLVNTPLKGVLSLFKLFLLSDWDKKIPIIMDMQFPPEFQNSPIEGDTGGRTNRAVQMENYIRRVEITRPQKLLGHLSQIACALTHRVSPERLRTISNTIPKVLIVTGDDDCLVAPIGSERLKRDMPEAEYQIWEKCGHAFHAQFPKRFHDTLERVFAEGKSKAEVVGYKSGST